MNISNNFFVRVKWRLIINKWGSLNQSIKEIAMEEAFMQLFDVTRMRVQCVYQRGDDSHSRRHYKVSHTNTSTTKTTFHKVVRQPKYI